MAIVLGLVHERLCVRCVALLVVEHTLFALTAHTFALEVAQVPSRACKTLSHQLDEAGLHDHAALLQSCVPQHARHARTAADPAAIEARPLSLCVTAASTCDALQHTMEIFPLVRLGRADASQLRRELVVIAHAKLSRNLRFD